MQKKYFIISFLILSLLGLAASLYLVYNHYYPNLQGGICDITAAVSCTVVNSGIYSTFFGIPVAVYGVAWFILSAMLSWKLWESKDIIPKLLWLNAGGLLFVFYFVYIEFLLNTICLFCTIVHIIVVLSLLLSIILYKRFYNS